MSHEFHSLTASDPPAAQVVVDPSGQVQAWNDGASQLFGYRADQALQQPLDALINPPDQEGFDATLAAAAAGQAVQGEHRCRRQDGKLLHVRCSLQAAVAAAGEPARIHCTLVDVTTAHVQHDREYVAARYRVLLELAPDAILIVNDIGRIVLFNAQARDLFCHAEADVMGAPVELLLPGRLRGAHARHRNGFLAAPRMRGMGAGLELVGMRSDGSEFPVEISLSPVDSDVGCLVMCAIRNTSERRRIERALQEKNLELERANRAKDSFLATMSHELRTPLNAILGFTELLLMQLPGPLNPAQQRQLELVQGSGRHLLSLINDLLDLAKIDAGKTVLHLQAIACQTLLEELIATLRPTAVAKGLLLELQTPVSPVLALADRRALQQIVLNLASNAIKFTARGLVRLRLSGTIASVCIAVEDTGVGIAPADQDRLFEPFRQLGNAQPAGNQGTGLGLHLSRRLAELMQGRIDFTSTLGQGSCFSLHLPAATADAA